MNEPLVVSERESLKIAWEFSCFGDYNLLNQGIFTLKAMDFQGFEFRLLKGWMDVRKEELKYSENYRF